MTTRIRRITQTIADLAGKPWSQLRVLDLASLEGHFALEAASHGAQALGIEGREDSNHVARGTAASMGLCNVEFITDDVRNFSRERFGVFDVVICSGILYHLPGEDGCRLIHAIAEACTRLTIVDTHVGQSMVVSVIHRGHRYHGDLFREHGEEEGAEVKLTRKLASLDNPTSFWITKPSLLNLLRDAGFSSVAEIHRPYFDAEYSDRVTLAAIKGERQNISILEEMHRAGEPDWPEISSNVPYPRQPAATPGWKRIARAVKRRLVV